MPYRTFPSKWKFSFFQYLHWNRCISSPFRGMKIFKHINSSTTFCQICIQNNWIIRNYISLVLHIFNSTQNFDSWSQYNVEFSASNRSVFWRTTKARNKDIKRIREFNTRKCSWLAMNKDMAHKLLISSDLLIAFLKQER